jgi:hypothetical protein
MKKATKKLALSRETLAPLGETILGGVRGDGPGPTAIDCSVTC